MISNDKNPVAEKPTLGGHVLNEDQNTTSANAEDKTLIKALQDLIVRVVDPMQKNDMNHIHLGPEAEKLITALQDFISSLMVRSSSGVRNTIEVSLDEEKNERELQGGVPDPDDDDNDGGSSSRGSSITETASSASGSDKIKNSGSLHLSTLDKPQSTFEEKLLRALQEHIFNKMPIRLLCFEPHGPTFQITLLERGAIYARVASALQEKMRDEEFQPETRTVHLSEAPYIVFETETETEIIQRLISKYTKYAIMSHTWLHTASGEMTYGDWNKRLFDAKDAGYRKLVNFCKAAWRDHRVVFGWMDTVCINKESSSELDESIRSMYNSLCKAQTIYKSVWKSRK